MTTETVSRPGIACSCCGELRPESDVVRMVCHPDVAVCGGCVGWMSTRVRTHPTFTPVFPVRDMTEAREFWTRTGATVELHDAGYAFIIVNGSEIAHLDLRPDLDIATNAAACYVHVSDPAAWRAQLGACGMPVTELLVQPWGMTEFSMTDPSGNLLRIGANTPARDTGEQPSADAPAASGAPAGTDPAFLDTADPVAGAVVLAVQAGDLDGLRELLTGHPTLATAHLGDADPAGMSRTLLHVATDWPGQFPRVAEVIHALVDAGADVNARFRGSHQETPLHWAASSNDVAALDALLDRGADIEATGAVIANGTPLADARAFGNWDAALRLVERGAHTTLTDSATLGLIDRVTAAFDTTPAPTSEETNRAFWGACHGGRLDCARYLLDRGAELNWIPDWEHLTPLDAARRREATELVTWLREQGAISAQASPGR